MSQARITLDPPAPPSALERAMVALQRARAKLESHERQRSEPIAVVGLACRFPGGANDLAAYWRLLEDGVDAVREVPRARVPADPAFPETFPLAALVDDVERFDAEFFGISAREAERLDPQQRLLLEVAWEALEIAGYAPNGLTGSRTGVYLGIGSPDYLRRILRWSPSEIDAQAFTGSLASVAAGRLAYVLGLQGPCMAIDTACSSSLVAVHQACRSLRSGESELAIAGGVNLILSPESTYVLGQLKALSPDGRCKTFDATANGYVRGEGCGLVVLKRLSDAQRAGDRIWALVRGSAVNQDGRSTGLTAPNVLAQEELLRQALRDARAEPHQIGYVETHGTGTALGDPIELEALTAVLGGPRTDGSSCVLGAVKTNIGHLEAASGAAGLIKAILAFEHQSIPTNLHFRTLNPRIALDGTPFVVANRAYPWKAEGKVRLAGVSSFGISGTNAEVILEEPPRPAPSTSGATSEATAGVSRGSNGDRTHHLLTLSARSPAALRQQVASFSKYLREGGLGGRASLGDACFTSHVGRAHFAHRAAFAAPNVDELVAMLGAWPEPSERADASSDADVSRSRRPKVAFLFSGQGSQYPGMGRGLYSSEPVFRAALDRCAGLFERDLPAPLLDVMWRDDSTELDRTLYSQPAIFAVEHALAALWRSWNIEPDVVIGHSLGEYAAATAAGVMTLEDACRVVAIRARECQSLGAGGAMVAVEADPAEAFAVVAEIGGDLAVAAYNGPRSVSLSGSVDRVRAAGERLAQRGARVKPINASCAFHSPLMAPMVAPFAEQLARISFAPPRVAWITNVNADRASADFDARSYWVRQLSAPVRFAECVHEARKLGCDAWIEMGAGPALVSAVTRILPEPQVAVPSLRRGHADDAVVMRAVGALYERGVNVDWNKLDLPFTRRRAALPTYPFERERHWFPFAEHRSLLGDRVDLPGAAIHFARALSADQPPELDAHRIYGQVVVPAALYVAAFLAAVRQTSGGGAGGSAIDDVSFTRALAIPSGQSVRVETVVEPHDDGARLRFFAGNGGADDDGRKWTLHATATESPWRRLLGSIDRAALRARCEQAIVPREALAGVWSAPGTDRASGVHLGLPFQRIDAIWRGTSETLARIAPGPERASKGGPDSQGEISPTLVDSCFQLIGVAFGATAVDDAWIPIAIDRVEIGEGPVERDDAVWAHARAGTADGGLVRGDVDVFDESGAPLLRITGVALKRVSRASLARSLSPGTQIVDVSKRRPAWHDWIHELTWRRVNPVQSPDARPAGDSAVLVVLDRSGYGERFARGVEARGGSVVRVVDSADLDRLDAAHGAHLEATRVISFAALDDAAAVAVAARGLAILQSTSRIPWRHAPRMWWVTAGAQAVAGEERALSVAQAALWGLVRCAALELADSWGGIIDLDPRDGAAAVDRLFDIVSGDDDQVAVRSGALFAARLGPAPKREDAAPPRLRDDATYIVSGGFGGVGWAIVRAWVNQGARHVVVVGRSGPSPEQRHRMAEDAERGVEVRVLQVDVADVAAVEARWSAIRHELPAVRGVVHAAGVLDDAAVIRQTPRHVDTVFAPKLAGAESLRRITDGAELDFFVLFSSLAGVLGSPGQSNYAAASSALDAFTHELRARGIPASSIAWGPWDAGVATSRRGAITARGVASMPVVAGVEALGECIARGRAHLVVTAADLAVVAARLPIRTRGILEAWAPKSHDDAKAPATDVFAAPPARRRALVLDRIVAEVRRVLGRAPRTRIDESQSLFEMGFDSLSAVELRTSLQRAFGRTLPASLAFEHPTVDALADALIELFGAGVTHEERTPMAASNGAVEPSPITHDPRLELRGQLPSLSPTVLATMAEAARSRVTELPLLAAEPIAIVGMGCRFPGHVASPADFWRMLRGGVDGITEVPGDRWNNDAWYDADPDAPGKTTIRHGGFLDDVAGFDAGFFRIAPREARCMDPQHRVLLEVAWQALEDAGQNPQRLAGSNTGAFVGFMNNDYVSIAELGELEGHLATGNGFSNAVGRLSFVLGIHGPSVALDTACSSSLVAIHLAVESLRKRECDLALAGGVNLILAPGLTVLMSKLGGLALDGHCKTFDAAADGYVRSEGCGIIVLKRLGDALRDRDRVVAVVRGSAVNHGGRSGGFSQPNGRAQQELIRRALASSQTLPHQIGYLEAHGTGTPLGDPIEYRALAAVLSAGRDPASPLHIGSVKTNIGHAEAAAGVAGVMKVALALHEREIPPHRNLTQLSPEIDLAAVPARIPTTVTPWEPIDGRRIAGVSGFGMSGINAHVILEELAPDDDSPASLRADESISPRRAELFALSARSEAALVALATAYRDALGGVDSSSRDRSLHDVAGTAGARRAHHEIRLGIVADDRAGVCAGLDSFLGGQRTGGVVTGTSEAGKRPRVVFVCPGQGSQWAGMGRELYATEPVFRDAIDRCDRAMQRHVDWRLVERLHATEPPASIDVVQPLLFAMSVGLGALWRSWGIEPDAVVGHSMGEVAAAHIAGALSLDDAARIICTRSRLMLDVAGRGAMAMVELGASDLDPRLLPYGDALCVAASNSTRSSVVTGDATAVLALLAELERDRVFARRIKVDVASHGPQVDPLARPLLDGLEGIAPIAGSIPIWSSVTASATDGAGFGPSYWMRNLRDPVRFADTVTALLSADHGLFVELSPHPILVTAIEHTAEDGRGNPAWAVGSLERNEPERAAMLRALAELYARGYPVDFRRLYPRSACVALPTYPFQRERYWVERTQSTPLLLRHDPETPRRTTHGAHAVTAAPAAEFDEASGADETANLLYELTWQSVSLPKDAARDSGIRLLILEDRGGVADELVRALEARGCSCAVLRASDVTSDDPQWTALHRAGSFHACVHLGCLDEANTPDQRTASAAVTLSASIVRTMTMLAHHGSPPLWIVTRGGQALDGESPSASQAPIWGLARALAAEFPAIRTALVDLDPSPERRDDRRESATLAAWLVAPHGESQLALRDGHARAARLARAAPSKEAPSPIRPDRAYWIVGGLSGLGGILARELGSRGARHLVVTGSRYGTGTDGDRNGDGRRDVETARELAKDGVSVTFATALLAETDAISTWLASASPPVAGAFLPIAPAALNPASPRASLPSAEALSASLTALVDDVWHAFRATRALTLDFVTIFAPAASLLGGVGQGAVAAASELAGALAARRDHGSSRVASLLLATWPGADDASLGGVGISPVDAKTVLDVALAAAGPHRMIASVDWPIFRNVYAQRSDERFLGRLGVAARGAGAFRAKLDALPAGAARSFLYDAVAREVRDVLGLAADQVLSSRLTFSELGMDSVMALKLTTRLGRALGERLPTVVVFEHPTAAALTDHIANDVLALGEHDTPATLDDDDLSEDELAELLAHKLGDHAEPA